MLLLSFFKPVIDNWLQSQNCGKMFEKPKIKHKIKRKKR